jgi:hypothetical protein
MQRAEEAMNRGGLDNGQLRLSFVSAMMLSGEFESFPILEIKKRDRWNIKSFSVRLAE